MSKSPDLDPNFKPVPTKREDFTKKERRDSIKKAPLQPAPKPEPPPKKKGG